MVIVLDLDLTLVYVITSRNYDTKMPVHVGLTKTITAYTTDKGEKVDLHIYLRPGARKLIDLLEKLEAPYGVWSTGTAAYVKAICDALEMKTIWRRDRSHCGNNSLQTIKDARTLPGNHLYLIIDDNVAIWRATSRSAFAPVKPWNLESDDDCLIRLLPKIASCINRCKQKDRE